MAQLLDSGIFSAVTTAGAIGVGWKLNFYITGTSTRLDTYPTEADAIAATNPNANPVVVPADGRVPACWLKDQDYKIILTDENGVVKNTTPVMPAISTRLSFIQAGTSAITRTNQTKLREVEVSITDFTGGTADGSNDNTAALQAAITSLTSGGVVKIPRAASAYRISMVTIAVADITIRLQSGATIKKYGSGGASERGIFKVANLLNANFTLDLNGGTIDLNGEGVTGIGTAGRIANTYAAKTVASIICTSGPSNAAVYALRASGLNVFGPGLIKNTGESALLFRNCGSTTVRRVDFENVCNYGVEFNIVAAAGDGGTGTMPTRGSCEVSSCKFTDINDFGLASGNGVAIGVGGAGNEGALKHYSFVNNRFLRCYREIHIEFLTGTYIEGFSIDGVDSEDSGQGSIGLIGARRGNLDNISILNPGRAPALALFYQITEAASPGNGSYPESTAIALSSDWEDITLGNNVVITDKRAGGVVYRTDGVATAASTTFTSAGATFASGDVGKPIGIIGAGPSGGTVVHETYITARASNTSITLEKAPVTSISSAKFAYGGGIRNPLSLYSGVSASIGEITVEGGSQFGLTSEPATAAAIRVRDVTGVVKIGRAKLKSGTNGSSWPCAIRMIDTGLDAAAASTFTGKLMRGNYYASGFTINEVGTYTRRTATVGQTVSTITDRAITASATLDTYGGQESIGPTAAFFTAVQSGSFEAAGGAFGGGETITFRLTANYFDSGSSSITIPVTALGTTQLTAKNMQGLNPDGVPIRSLVYDMKSSINNTVVTGKVNLTAAQS